MTLTMHAAMLLFKQAAQDPTQVSCVRLARTSLPPSRAALLYVFPAPATAKNEQL